MTLLGALLRHRDPVEERAITPSMLAWGRGDGSGLSVDEATGVKVTRDTVLGQAAVWACVSLIADSIATLPVDTVQRDTNGVYRPYRPRPVWLDIPNPEQTKVDFIFGQVASLLLDGCSPIYTLRDRKGDVVEAYALDPNWVQIRREIIDGKPQIVYYVMVSKGQQSPVGPFRVVAGPEMFHINAFQPNASWPRGLAPLEVARQMFGSGIAGQEMGARYFGHGMNAAGVVEVPDDLAPEQAQQLKKDFGKANAGLKKMHLPPVLTGGATWKQIQISPEQAQFLQQRQFSAAEIASFYRVPPHMIATLLDKTSSWGTGIEQQSIGFARFTLRPWIERLEEGWSRHMMLFEPKGTTARFDIEGLMRGDSVAQADYWSKRFMSGSASANDQRKAFGEDAIAENGDVYYFPVNMAPAGTEPLKIEKQPAVDVAPKTDEAPPAGTTGTTAGATGA